MLNDLRLRNFRCFDQEVVELGGGFNLFLGANGQGKTTLLEAACVLLRLQSQRSPSLAPVVQRGKSAFAVRGRADEHDLELLYGAGGRRAKFDGIEQRTFGEYLRIARVVSFANADIELARGASEARRRYLDFSGAQIDPTYRTILRTYERALRARNVILKSPNARPRELAAYDSLFIENGERLLRLRAKLAETIAPLAADAYQRIAAAREELTIRFAPGASSDLAGDLRRSQSESARLRQTIVGPHRDDLELRIDDMPAAQFGSEGQQRTIALALKIAQAGAFQSAGEGKSPLLLIDDVFGELDIDRRNALLDNLPAGSQKMVTATSLEWHSGTPADTIYELREQHLVRK